MSGKQKKGGDIIIMSLGQELKIGQDGKPLALIDRERLKELIERLQEIVD